MNEDDLVKEEEDDKKKTPVETESNLHHIPDFPWFGLDVGGTLVKLVYFEPLDLSKEEEVKEGDVLRTIRHYLIGNTAYGDTGIRDVNLEIKSIKIGDRFGNLHFIRFPTNHMENFIDLCVTRKLHTLTFQVFATGGGAFKFESDVTQRLKVGWNKCDELDMLIQGVEFLNEINSDKECYYFDILPNDDLANIPSSSSTACSSSSTNPTEMISTINNYKYIKQNYRFSNAYPYILVNIGSGVSILLVKSETDYKRISGTSIGGGTFLGLCCLLTGCNSYEEAISLAAKGDSTKVDKLVRDIYGGDYSRFGLPGNVVASSFGYMHMEEKRNQAGREDLARATLQTILNNVGLIARDCASNYQCERVLFVGSFLRLNEISMQLLSYATNYWSKGTIKALFLEHEGYFGAVGCMKNFIRN